MQLNSTVDGNLVTSLNGVRAGRYKLTLQNNPAGFLFYIDPAESWTFSSVNSYRGYAIWPFIVGFGSALILAFGFVVYRKESEKKKLSQHKPSNHEWVPLDTVEWE